MPVRLTPLREMEASVAPRPRRIQTRIRAGRAVPQVVERAVGEVSFLLMGEISFRSSFSSLLVAAIAIAGAGCKKECTPGESIACVGPGGCSGGQVCNADGT